MSKADDWRTITHSGSPVRVRTPGLQNQAHVERHGASVFLMSDALDGDELAVLAAGLKRVSTTGTI